MQRRTRFQAFPTTFYKILLTYSMKKNSKKNQKKTSSLGKLTMHSSAKAGMPPGTLTYIGEQRDKKAQIDVFNYSEEIFNEKTINSFDDCLKFINRETITWINIEGIHDVEVVKGLGREFKINNLVLEDVLNTNQRGKIEDFNGYIYLVMKMLSYNEKKKEVEEEQVSLIFSDNYVLTLQEGTEGDVFSPVRERLRLEKSTVRKMSSDYLVFSLIDVIVDNYFVILEKIGEEMEALDSELINNPNPSTLDRIYSLKREIIYIRKAVWPLREIINKLERDESDFIKEKTKIYFRDVYDHAIQVIDNIETYRDIISGMMDLYLSSISNKMNEIMKVLTIIGTIFIPLTFIVGVYGMNFEFMPELKMRYAYPITWIVMIFLGLSMLLFFRKRNWI
jgi:magnesium transporter